MTAEALLAALENSDRHRRRIAAVRTLDGREAAYGSLKRPLSPRLSQMLDERDIHLYTHQCRAIEACRQGRSLILTTPTASGKTLGFSLPVLERLEAEPAATALFIYPTKALARDQMRVLLDLEASSGIRTGPAVYDGDTPQGRRPQIRNQSRIVITNPYELHQVLPWHYKWSRFLAGLQFVVIDEAHRYRGVFGSSIALLLRRLERVCRGYRRTPQYLLSTATLANPEEFGELLTGHPCQVIEGNGAPQQERHVVLYNPYVAGETGSTITAAAEVMLDAVRQDLQTLCFAQSRKTAEVITTVAKEYLLQAGEGDRYELAAYRAGYLPSERRDLENRLQQGLLHGLTTTSALEVGIDIGSLDAVVLCGYPGTMIATWQQIGRAGRREVPSVAAVIAQQGPLDQYYMHHPEAFFAAPHEQAILDLGNPAIVSGQLLCAAAELPLTDNDQDLFGPLFSPLTTALVRERLLAETESGLVYAGRQRATEAVKLDGLSGDIFRVVADGRVLETLDRHQAYREAFAGAILLHQGETFAVTTMDPENLDITAEPVDVEYTTKPLHATDITAGEVATTVTYPGLTIETGDVTVQDTFTGYQIRQYGEVLATHHLDLPPLTFQTRGVSLKFSRTLPQDLAEAGLDPAGALHGAEHALIAVMPVHLLCDRQDIGGVSMVMAPETDGPLICIYDSCPGGAGLTARVPSLLGRLAAMAGDLVASCPCTDGCPACIHSPKCGNDNAPLDKQGTVMVLRAITAALTPS
ncbi:DEAD/DEAH box helicase [Methanosphaerula subterraneus]|uniref:DEAD/DEAH box helicase n=1 Tax=Methanosphaerula subterraneus TaxID=3350244 RepID=UPI003F8706E6